MLRALATWWWQLFVNMLWFLIENSSDAWTIDLSHLCASIVSSSNDRYLDKTDNTSWVYWSRAHQSGYRTQDSRKFIRQIYICQRDLGKEVWLKSRVFLSKLLRICTFGLPHCFSFQCSLILFSLMIIMTKIPIMVLLIS